MNLKSIILIIGTKGNVLPIDQMIQGVPCKVILCNTVESKDLYEEYFDKIYYESIESAWVKIEKDIEDYWN